MLKYIYETNYYKTKSGERHGSVTAFLMRERRSDNDDYRKIPDGNNSNWSR